MKISKHTHPRYIVWIKYFMAVSAFLMPFYLLYSLFTKHSIAEVFSSLHFLPLFIAFPFYPIFLLTAAYFFQDIIIASDGLLVEFLWKDLNVPWDKIIEIKSAFGFWRSPRNTKVICIVLTNALTPFHRLFGLVYGPSVKPSFIIFPTISEYQSLVETIKRHAKKN